MKKYSIDVKTVTDQLGTLHELIQGIDLDHLNEWEKDLKIAEGLKIMLSNIKEGLSDDGQIIITRK